MDPITLAITAALGHLGETVIKDAYDALKNALQHKYGVQAPVAQAVSQLEAKPESKPRQAVVQEEVESSGASQDPEVLRFAQALLEHLKELPGSNVELRQDVNIRGNRNIVTGQGDVNVNE